MRQPKNLKVTKDNVARVMKSMRAMAERQVLVGIPSETADRKPDQGEAAAPINNATIGYIMEFGSPAKNIPARPHLIPGSKKAMPEVIKTYRIGAKLLIDGDASGLEKAHMAVGLKVQSAVKQWITDSGHFAPLAPATLAGRRARGRKGEKPLIDTGQYRNSITFVIRQKGR